MKHLKWLGGLAAMALLLSSPQDAARGAARAMAQWHASVAPALFPFLALMPLLTSGEAMAAYEALLSPFKKIGLPAHELAMMMTIALRFIPTLLEETDKIIKAQQARGADFESGNLFRRAKALVPILVPLFISAFRIAQDLAMAMEARCYGGNVKRTRMNAMKFARRDLIAAILFCLFLAIVVAQRVLL